MNIKGKVALVTGAGSGIGAACAQILADYGIRVAVTDINIESARMSVDVIRRAQGEALAYAMDVSDEQMVDEVFRNVVNDFGTIDILLCNAGIQIVHSFPDFPFSDWQKMLKIHADGAFLTSRAAYRIMQHNNGGKIVFMGSVHSHLASALKAPYCFAKHGILGLARVIAKEGVEHNIQSYVICPGFVRTPLAEKQIPEQAKIKGISEEEVIKNIMLKDTIDGKFTTFKEVADLLIYFIQDEQGALSGQSILVSHGWGMI